MKGETTLGVTSRTGPRLSPVGELVRRHDRDRYQTALFAPAQRREALLALYAFNYEIARVRETVTQLMLGQIRLQWWREAIAAAYGGTPPRAHVVVQPLTAAIGEFELTRGHFERLIDAREGDLADAAPPTMAALVDYAEATSAPVVYLALEILGMRDSGAMAIARDVGIAYALAGLLRALPFHARAGRRYIPDDVMARAGFDPTEPVTLRASEGLRRAVTEIADAAQRHVRLALHGYRSVPRSTRSAVLTVIIAHRYLTRLRRAGYDPFAASLARSDGLQPWRLLLAMLRDRI